MFHPPARVALATLAVTSAIAIACSRPRLAADLVITRADIWTGNSAQQLDNVDLKDAGSQAEFARRISERAKAKPGEWILGGNWDDRRWTPAALPTRQLIDDVSNSTPVFVVRDDGHVALANSAALGRAGITERTEDPPGGAIVRDANRFPTGVLKDAAMDVVTRVIPKTTPEQRLHAVKRALEHAASLGVTSVHDMNATYEDIAVHVDLANRGELTARVYAATRKAAGTIRPNSACTARSGRRGCASAPCRGKATGSATSARCAPG